MRFGELCKKMENVLVTNGTNNKKKVVVDFLKSGEIPCSELACAVRWMTGQALPANNNSKLNFAAKQLAKAKKLAKETPMKTSPTLYELDDFFTRLARLQGENSDTTRTRLVADILGRVPELDRKYIEALILGRMPVGYGISDKNMLDCIADAYGQSRDIVVEKYTLCSDVGMIALRTYLGQLEDVKLSPFRPFKPMLADAYTIEETAARLKLPALAEFKYDGARCLAHKTGEKVILYSRGLENITDAFPEIARGVRSALATDDAILDGEIIAVKDDKPLPFQELSKRIKRQKNVDETMQQIPVEYRAFDVLWLNGDDLTKKPLQERTDTLLDLLMYAPDNIRVADGLYIVESDDTEECLRTMLEISLDQGYEGLVVKELSEPYRMDERSWIKIKAIQEKATALDTLDCVVTGFRYGTGKYADMVGSLRIGVAWDISEGGGFANVGDVGTGMTDKVRHDLLEALEPLIISTIPSSDGGYRVDVFNERVIVEVAFEEIQKSRDTDSGYSLRFPRLVRVRDDKSMPDGISKVERMFKAQKKVAQ